MRMTKSETVANDEGGKKRQLAVFSFVAKWLVAGQIVFGAVLDSYGGENPDGLFRSLQNSVEGETQLGRLTVAVLGFENRTRDSEAEHWRLALESLVCRQLAAVKSGHEAHDGNGVRIMWSAGRSPIPASRPEAGLSKSNNCAGEISMAL